MAPLNVVLLVVDSLRAQSIAGREPGAPSTPFLASMAERSVAFERAYATECWTLPSHMSMFTGLLPSEHGAHFQSMAYTAARPTIAELLAVEGYSTEAITRNSVFDGSIPGVLRGFQRLSRPLAEIRPADAVLHGVLALAKPRVRRLIRESGFFHRSQKSNREFLWQLVRMGMPADRLALDLALERMTDGRKAGKPGFLFLNLYDVHAPYSPTESSAIPSLRTFAGWAETAALPAVLPRISSHGYLRPNFTISDWSRRMLLGRYHRAIELMDRKLERFWCEAAGTGLLDDTVLIIASDHGEGFGEHGLYLHDASVYETHLHVPLFVHWPGTAAGRCESVVSLRSLFDLIRAAGQGTGPEGTILDADWRASNPAALAQHFHYSHGSILPQFRRNLVAAISARSKVVRRGSELVRFDLERDQAEECAERLTDSTLRATLHRAMGSAASLEVACGHLREAA